MRVWHNGYEEGLGMRNKVGVRKGLFGIEVGWDNAIQDHLLLLRLSKIIFSTLTISQV